MAWYFFLLVYQYSTSFLLLGRYFSSFQYWRWYHNEHLWFRNPTPRFLVWVNNSTERKQVPKQCEYFNGSWDKLWLKNYPYGMDGATSGFTTALASGAITENYGLTEQLYGALNWLWFSFRWLLIKLNHFPCVRVFSVFRGSFAALGFWLSINPHLWCLLHLSWLPEGGCSSWVFSEWLCVNALNSARPVTGT